MSRRFRWSARRGRRKEDAAAVKDGGGPAEDAERDGEAGPSHSPLLNTPRLHSAPADPPESNSSSFHGASVRICPVCRDSEESSETACDCRAAPHDRISRHPDGPVPIHRHNDPPWCLFTHRPRAPSIPSSPSCSSFPSPLPSRRFLTSTLFSVLTTLFLLTSWLPPPVVSTMATTSSTPYSYVMERMQRSADSQCFVWSNKTTECICNATKSSERIKILNNTYVFAKPEHPGVRLLSLFTAGKETDSPKRHLSLMKAEMADCIKGPSDQCMDCMAPLDSTFTEIQEALKSFRDVLDRFDCMPAIDTASATRPFSPNASCVTCLDWYHRWLVSQLLNVWKAAPCIQWCYSAQLACPHLATAKVVDYAGHPSFQCRDLYIPDTTAGDETEKECNCVHPCDIKGIVNESTSLAAEHMCKNRKKMCSATQQKHNATTTSSVANNSPLAASLLILLTFLVLVDPRARFDSS